MTQATAAIDRGRPTSRWPILLQSGFRPFFLFAGLQASLFVLLWTLVWAIGWDLPLGDNPILWHGHAMLFGFAAAALAGFLLTAVPNWTEAGPVRRLRLVLLVGFWLAAQILSLLPWAMLFAVADIGFWLLLIAFIAPGILKRNAKRNGVFVVILSGLTGLNLLWHLSLRYDWQDTAMLCLQAALGFFLLAIGIIGGRIIPAFTIGGLLQAGHSVFIVPAPKLGLAANVVLALALISKLAALPVPVQVGAYLLAAGLHGWRLSRWWRREVLQLPIIWSLHLGYLFLPLGFALEAAGAARLVPAPTGIHALGSGGVGLMILAVMTRASLGHTGRRLASPPAATAAYLLVAAGALLRIIAAALPELAFSHVLLVASGLLWSAGFAAFVIGYARILIAPRIDGRPG
ncbi:NnrS family protein [Ferrovibrio sp.]|uniref:NnrS family protein n=1 Tax=Ferrovibrio sp. TaxID=1917215 RepID=UPI002624EFE5|nr:NnrS family protein [Ferrovibrio sp.]